MKIIPLINEFTNTFNEIFQKNLSPLNLESKIRDAGDMFTLKLYKSFLNSFSFIFTITSMVIVPLFKNVEKPTFYFTIYNNYVLNQTPLYYFYIAKGKYTRFTALDNTIKII